MNQNEAYQYNHGYEKCSHCGKYIHEILRERVKELIDSIPDFDSGSLLDSGDIKEELRDKWL